MVKWLASDMCMIGISKRYYTPHRKFEHRDKKKECYTSTIGGNPILVYNMNGWQIFIYVVDFAMYANSKTFMEIYHIYLRICKVNDPCVVHQSLIIQVTNVLNWAWGSRTAMRMIFGRLYGNPVSSVSRITVQYCWLRLTPVKVDNWRVAIANVIIPPSPLRQWCGWNSTQHQTWRSTVSGDCMACQSTTLRLFNTDLIRYADKVC